MCLLVSCAHKSGHKRLNRSAESATERESVRTPDSEDNVTSATAEYGDNNEILNGKTIFNRYEGKKCGKNIKCSINCRIYARSIDVNILCNKGLHSKAFRRD